jgi:DNA-binding transcriptional ArsR family regulator
MQMVNQPGYIIAKLLLNMMQAAAQLFLESDTAASDADCVLLCAAVYIGQCERRPMTAGKIADFIGMPRPTVSRKLGQLKKRGIVFSNSRQQWCITSSKPEIARRIVVSIDALLPLVHSAASKLSKMDSATVASKR